MPVFRQIILSGTLAGLIVGIVLTIVQHFGTIPLILQAEVYEQAEEAKQGHDHGDHEAWQPADGFERNAYTALFNLVEWIGFGFVLAGGLALSKRQIDWREGFLWGLAGFLTFVAGPALGLPPELPGIPASPLEPRQVWWICTAAATAGGLYLIAFKRSPAAAVAAILLLAAPHLVGAPHPDSTETEVPEILTHRFVITVALTTLLSWSLLGGLTGYFYRRLASHGSA
jgi:cobalt transporter subunit CbtA